MPFNGSDKVEDYGFVLFKYKLKSASILKSDEVWIQGAVVNNGGKIHLCQGKKTNAGETTE
jgi:hypothetical protein